MNPIAQSTAETPNAASTPCTPASVVDSVAMSETDTIANTEVRIAVPSEPAIWRKVLFTEVPMIDQVVRQRVHRPGGDGHVDERHAEKTDSHDNRHIDEAHFRS